LQHCRNNRRDRMSGYLDLLHREIALVGQMLPAGQWVRRIAFGAAPTRSRRPISSACSFAVLPLVDPVISIELDPRSLDAPAAAPPGSASPRQPGRADVRTGPAGSHRPRAAAIPDESCTALLRGAG
jgi:oxygen-independent coproporphyrinogen-3 oxidase